MLSKILLVGAVLLGSSNLLMAADKVGGKVFFRYVNDEGVKVLHHSIPPKYAQKGYEVVSLSGKVVRVVPPALTAEQAAEKEANMKLEEQLAVMDERLLRRYSSPADIAAAKRRKLATLDTNIAILNSKIQSTKIEIKAQQKKAADIERAGREVPKKVVKVLIAMENDLEDSQEQVRLRLLEYQEVADKFERDIARFKEINPRR